MKKVIYYIILLLCMGAGKAGAQYSFSGNITSSVSIQPVTVLSLTNNASTAVTLSNTQLSNGYTVTGFNTINIKSNQAWNLSVTAVTPYFSASGTYASANMPASVIGLAKSGQSSFINLSTTAQLLASGNRGSYTTSGNSFNMDFKANPGYNYGPGIYSLSILYTLSAQ